MKKLSYFLFTVIFCITFTYGQSTKKFVDTGSVKNQFDYLFEKSNRYQEYKVVKSDWLIKLKKNVSDSLNHLKNNLSNSSSIINAQLKTVDSLKTVKAVDDKKINLLTSEKQSISFLGIQFNKAIFKTIMIVIISTLIIFLGIFITKFKQSNQLTNLAKLKLKELEEEFDTHRKIAIEREQKVRRQLQDELNKQKRD